MVTCPRNILSKQLVFPTYFLNSDGIAVTAALVSTLNLIVCVITLLSTHQAFKVSVIESNTPSSHSVLPENSPSNSSHSTSSALVLPTGLKVLALAQYC